MSSATNNKLILKNTLMLYIRQIIVLFVGLYTSRLILKNLGVVDFGIYNVVAGVVTILGFLSSSMTTACQRYFSYDIGIKDFNHLSTVYSNSFFVYLMISAVIMLISETVGLWFVRNKLTIPAERLDSAVFVLHVSVVTFIITIMTIPFTAIITAYEDMGIYAWMSIYECSIKLILIIGLGFISYDKLKTYSLILLFIPLSNFFIYQFICCKKYKDLKIKFSLDIHLLKELFGYIIWNALTGFAGAMYNQGLNFILNIYCGPVVNSARAISAQVNGAVVSFAGHFSAAIQPQLIKNYALKDYEDLYSQLFRGIKLTFALIFILVLPLSLQINLVLKFWLGDYPKYTSIFVLLTLWATCIEVITYSLDTLNQATGKVRLYQFFSSFVTILNIPISIIFLANGIQPYYVISLYGLLMIVSIIIRVLILNKIVENFNLKLFLAKTILPIIEFVCVSIPIPYLINKLNINKVILFFLVVLFSILSVLLAMYFVLLDKNERKTVKVFIDKKIKRNN